MKKFKQALSSLVLLLIVCKIAHCVPSAKERPTKKPLVSSSDCSKVKGFTPELRAEIRAKVKDVEKIVDLVLNGEEKHSTYNELALLCDTFGSRLSGSEALNRAIEHMRDRMSQSKLDNVHLEKAMVQKWEVGTQWAQMVEPVKRNMSILALGLSVGTNQVVEAEVVLVKSFDELDQLGKGGELKDKIVVHTYNFTSYGENVAVRSRTAKVAAQYGALVALIRSVTPFSIYSPHTGQGSKSIPTAALTVEDTDMIQRWVERNKKVVLRVYIEAQNFDDVESYNVIGDLKGTSKPDEIVLVSGHIDTWYNTAGAMDDGGGLMISYKALDVLRKLNLRAKRTIRAVLWTSEEFGSNGAQQYMKDHQSEIGNFKVVMESDLGTFRPLGLESAVSVGPLGQCVTREILNLTSMIGTTKLSSDFEGQDIKRFVDLGVPGFSLLNENSKYFYFHHTSGDSITMENPDDLDKSTILWAVASYVFADLDVDFRS